MDFNEYVLFINSDLRILKGIGEKKATLFSKLGINTIWDLIYNFPRGYEDRSHFYTIESAPINSPCCIKAYVRGAVIEKKLKKNMSLYILRAEDSTGFINVKWFSSPFNKNKVKRGMRYSFYGSIEQGNGIREMILKDMEPDDENILTGRIMPIYALTNGLTQRDFRNFTQMALGMIENVYETLPQMILNKYKLLPLDYCVRQMHTPVSFYEQEKARYRLSFEELYMLSLALKRLRCVSDVISNVKITNIRCALDFSKDLPFELTADQKNSINDICVDLMSPRPMNRLIQGDVGSGKTAVAATAAYVCAKNGYQTAFMAPTDILANQHYNTLVKYFEKTDFKVGIITGSTKNKNTVLDDIRSGNYDIVVGTHALLEQRVVFKKLGLCVTDEQHRFGVIQRSSLSKGDGYPNILVMSATPIPRTLSLVLYGDLDISLISTMPSGRQKIDTFCINSSMRERLNKFIQKQIDDNGQSFVVCPLIEDSDKIDALSSSNAYQSLSQVFPKEKVGFLHGKMSATEKDEIMNKFRSKEYMILVSTTVIEVGIDIPDATLMVIENAERFGLSQLHQLRGRVGRGSKKSYCVLVSDTKTDDAKERMKIMCTHSDGFEVANEDLRLRGCGEFFGTRQHGVPELRIANLFTDLAIVKLASEACEHTLRVDRELNSDDFKPIKSRIDKLFTEFANIKIFN